MGTHLRDCDEDRLSEELILQASPEITPEPWFYYAHKHTNVCCAREQSCHPGVRHGMP